MESDLSAMLNTNLSLSDSGWLRWYSIFARPIILKAGWVKGRSKEAAGKPIQRRD